MAKLYATVTGSDSEIEIPRSKFITWLMPGIPFKKEDFAFCQKGFVGETAEESLNLYHQAFVLSKLFDYVPEVGKDMVDEKMQQAMFATSQDTLSSVYSDILTYSKVVDHEPTDEQKAKMEQFRNLLTVKKEVVASLITGEKKMVTSPGPLTEAYNAKLNEYITAVDEYMNLLIEAQAARGNSEEAQRRVAAFSNKSKAYKMKMQAAKMAWVTEGYKNDYDEINAYIAQVTERSMLLYKESLKNDLQQALLSSASDGGSEFYYTTLIPGNFAESDGWTQFSFEEIDSEEHSNKSTSAWSASGGGNYGLFAAKANASGSREEEKLDSACTNFKATFKFTQIPICRPFFKPGFLMMKGWTLDNMWDLNFNNLPVTDGQQKPTGRLVAYASQALFVKDVSFEFSEASSHFDKLKKAFTAGGSVGWGPFKVGGSYSKSSETSNTVTHTEGNSIKIEGIQYIGSINHFFDTKIPDLNPEIKPEDLV